MCATVGLLRRIIFHRISAAFVQIWGRESQSAVANSGNIRNGNPFRSASFQCTVVLLTLTELINSTIGHVAACCIRYGN
jgi:hypothetical protein